MIELNEKDLIKMCQCYESLPNDKKCKHFTEQCSHFKKPCIITVFREREQILSKAHHIIKCYCGEFLFYQMPDEQGEVELIEILSKKQHECCYYTSVASKVNANKFLSK